MKIQFTKMQGAGNDFIVINALSQKINLTPHQIQSLADRRLGIGADQVLIIEEPRSADIDFHYRIYNADGSEVEQCGNGARAIARFVIDQNLTTKKRIQVETMARVMTLIVEQDGRITVDMGAPILVPAQVPFDTAALHSKTEGDDILWPLAVNGKTIWISVVNMGNPHAVQVVPDIQMAAVADDGSCIERHPRFPQRTNAGFMQIIDRHHIRLRVFERGAGETMACGSGACAAVVAGIRRHLLQSPVIVHTQASELSISWTGAKHPVMMTGPAVTVFIGEIDI